MSSLGDISRTVWPCAWNWRALLVAAFPAAICEAMQRPNMRFVPVNSQVQQARLMVLRARRQPKRGGAAAPAQGGARQAGRDDRGAAARRDRDGG